MSDAAVVHISERRPLRHARAALVDAHHALRRAQLERAPPRNAVEQLRQHRTLTMTISLVAAALDAVDEMSP